MPKRALFKDEKRALRWLVISIGALLAFGASAAPRSPPFEVAQLPDDLTELSIEQLLDIQVTSVARTEQNLFTAPAAIDVITHRDLMRSGAQNLPQALRMATGLQVAQINGRQWAIAARGFNSGLSDKLEVRLNGRTLYTPLFSGVIWEFLDQPLDDIERIEVIRGPGAALWGANAMNGVINIVTRSAQESGGSRVAVGGGSSRLYRSYARHTMQVGEQGAVRVFVQSQSWDNTENGTMAESRDERDIHSGGMQADLSLSERDDLLVTLDGTTTDMGSSQAREGESETMQGAALVTRWTRKFNPQSDVQLQLSADYFDRDIPGHFGEIRRQAELDVKHRWQPAPGHDLVWGLGARRSSDDIRNSAAVIFEPASRNLDYFNLYAQDRIALSGDLELTAGARLEHNDYTGVEFQPNLRLGWQLGERQFLWSALAQASRAPNRVDRDFVVPGPEPGTFVVVANDSFESEIARVAELGWRSRPLDNLTVSLTAFYADYDDLRGIGFNADGDPVVGNEGEGHSIGGELSLSWQPVSNIEMHLGYSYLDLEFHPSKGSQDPSIEAANENDPTHQANLRVIWDVSPKLTGFAHLRFVDALPDLQTPAYTQLDMEWQYRLTDGISIAVGGRNLLDREHPEFNDGSQALVERSGHVELRWDF